MADWTKYKGQTPWIPSGPDIKLGYQNNPRFQQSTIAPTHILGSPVWTPPGGNIQYSKGASVNHKPCGYWHKGATDALAREPECVALWRFEPSALLLDSADSNNLTGYGTYSSRTSTYKEGIGCVDIERNGLVDPGYLVLPEAVASSDMPFKYGTSNKIMSITFWIRLESFISLGRYYSIFSKQSKSVVGIYRPGMKFWLYRYDATHFQPRLDFVSDLGIQEINSFSFNVVSLYAAQWYHMCLRVDGNNGSASMIVYNDGSGVTESDNVTFTNPKCPAFVTADYTFGITLSAFGSGYDVDSPFDGYLDEFAVFDRFLTSDEVHSIRNGTFNFGV